MSVTVLIVDDSGVIRDGLRSILAIYPDIHVVGEATNGLDALDKVASLNPDVVLMDGQMPCMDGVEATRTIKSRDPGRRILFFTVYATHASEARQAGADGFLLKDCSRKELIDTIRNLAPLEADQPGGTNLEVTNAN